MNCNTTHYRANSSSVPGDPTQPLDRTLASGTGFSLSAIPAGPSAAATLPVSSPADPAEREAEAAAEQAILGERVRLPAPPAAARSDPPSSGPVADPGRPLEPAVRAAFEPQFGASFADVRLHDDSAADAAARSIGARAFTFGSHVAFAAGEYAPDTSSGRHLLAHELAHVRQQPDGGDAMLHRFPYETRAFDPTPQIRSLTPVSYWTARTAERYDLTQDRRMSNDAEERDAVLAALWAQNPPTTVTSPQEMIVPVQARPAPAGGAAPPALLYRFRFVPPTAPATLPELHAEFMAEGPGAVPAAAPPPAPGVTPPAVMIGAAVDFPAGGTSAYFAAWPQERDQLMNFLGSAPALFDRHLTTATTTGTRTTHSSFFHAVRDASDLTVTLISETAPAGAVTMAADYRTRDAGDFELELLRRPTRAAADRLGTVTLPAGLAADERLAVNLAIVGYFDTVGARNSEIDAIVPIGTSGARSVLFTLRFGAGNDVTVERIGDSGTGPRQVNIGRIDVTRVNGFPGATAADSALRSWWTARYRAGGTLTTPVPAAPSPPPTGAPAPTPAPPNNAALIAEMNSLISTGSTSAAWFQGNYGLDILSGQDLYTRLDTVHSVDVTLLSDTIDFASADFTGLEITMQTLATAEFQHLSGVKVGRKNTPIENVGGTWQRGPATLYGLTLWNTAGTERTIVYFDNLTNADRFMFGGGGAATALPASTMRRAHELGHAAERHGGIRAAFAAWRRANRPANPTWYAADDPAREFFPEAYALFHSDPHFLCSSAPLVYAWFLELANSGTPPRPRARLTPPATCPP